MKYPADTLAIVASITIDPQCYEHVFVIVMFFPHWRAADDLTMLTNDD